MRLFLRMMAAAASLLVFGIVIATVDWLGVDLDDNGGITWVVYFVAIFLGGTAARPAGDAIKRAMHSYSMDDDEEGTP